MSALLTPLLALLAPIFRSIFKFFGIFFLKDLGKIYRLVGALTIYISLVTIFITSLTTLTTNIISPMPLAMKQAIYCFMPANFIPCVSAVASARIIAFFFEIKLHVILFLLFASGRSSFARTFSKYMGIKKGW